MPTLFDGVYAPSTLGVLLREFSFGHARQLKSVLRDHLVAVVEHSEPCTPDRISARLVLRRVKDARYPDALFPLWRYHPFLTNSELPTTEADIVHRRHAVIETVFAT